MTALLLVSILAAPPAHKLVERRVTELSDDLLKNEWQWAFAWTELTRAKCPDEHRHQCQAFAALRDGQWDALVKLLEQDVVIDAHDDALLKMVARLGLREAETAQAGPL